MPCAAARMRTLEFLGVRGLQHVAEGAALQGIEDELLLRVPRQNHHRDVRMTILDLLAGIDPVEFGQRQVEQHYVRLEISRRIDRRATRLDRGHDFEAVDALDHALQPVQEQRVIVGKQNPGGGVGHSSPSARWAGRS